MNWTEKYRPITLKEIAGNRLAKEKLVKWARSWMQKTPSKPAAILCGKPGIGKTTSAYAIANLLRWKVIELNASDQRNKEVIEKIALTGAVNELLSIDGEFIPSNKGVRRLILLDEADNLYDRGGDFGGKRAIIETIKVTRQPIILIANDYYELIRGGGSGLKTLCEKIEFKPVHDADTISLLQRIARQEHLQVDSSLIHGIAQMCEGDIRSAINDLQSLAYEKKLDKTMLSRLGYRDREQELFKGLQKIFKARDMKFALRESQLLNESPDKLILWVDENIPHEYKDKTDRQRAYEFLSRADVFLGRTWRRQYYGCWRYAHDLMVGGVAVSKSHVYREFNRFSFPQWLRRMGRSKHNRALKASIAGKIGDKLHVSKRKASEQFPFFTRLCSNDDIAARLTVQFNLTEKELELLARGKPKEILHEAKVLKKSSDTQAVLGDYFR